jgi:hypothetical protein
MSRRQKKTSAVRFAGDSGLWFTVELPGGWSVVYFVAASPLGRPIVQSVHVVPSPAGPCPDERTPPRCARTVPEGGLTATYLRERVTLAAHVFEDLPVALKGFEGGRFAESARRLIGSLGFDPDVRPERGRRGPKGTPDSWYALLAADYLDAIKGGSRSPVADLAKERGMSEVGLRAALNRARKRGLLTRKGTGRAGGTLTPRAVRILRGGLVGSPS